MSSISPPPPIIDPLHPHIWSWPHIGLTLIHEFISEAEEAAMISAFHERENCDPSNNTGKKRISQHFGYHFDYTTFGVSTFSPVPDYITAVLPRLPLFADSDSPEEDLQVPDQFTVQYYPPGSGIPPHVDTHSMFGEALYSLSYGSAVPMVFRMSGKNDARKLRLPKRSLQTDGDGQQEPNGGGFTENGGSAEVKKEKSEKEDRKDGERQEDATAEEKGNGAVALDEEEKHPAWELMLPPRSLLVMRGASRYGYTHGIRPRKTDVAPDGSMVRREGRYSITMRIVRRGDEIRCRCAWPGVCDARVREEGEAAAREKASTT
ncbi:alkylated DNA repair protein alkB 8 [Podospora australis]|uniref:Alkylated DNA repair protein alkB 8 n=1 Tax=Podospora australis TaxID=1536484 RepID=A0AAN7AGX9_9PEZI|nr:alkylated DNA repair protein alkB 8 [Podospora australis]